MDAGSVRQGNAPATVAVDPALPGDGPEGLPVLRARRSRSDVIFGFGTALGALLMAVWVIPHGVTAPSSVKALPLSPTFLPYVLTACIGLLGLVCGCQAAFGRGVPSEDDARLDVRPRWPLRLLVVLAIFLAYYAFAEPLGMLPVAVVLMGMMLWLGGERSVLRGLLLSVALPLGVYLFFTQVAQVPLPAGILEDLL